MLNSFKKSDEKKFVKFLQLMKTISKDAREKYVNTPEDARKRTVEQLRRDGNLFSLNLLISTSKFSLVTLYR